MAGHQGKGVGMISFSVAMEPDKGIGIRGSLPWHLKDELKLFKQNTLYKHILMGQTTYDNLPRKLVDRYITVVSIDPEYKAEDVEVENDLIAFLEKHQNDETEYIICGGASIYRQAYPYCRKAYVSFVKDHYETDTRFDCFDLNDWNIIREVDYPDFIYRELERKTCSK
jgi:dihydrofolate reductase